MADADLPEAAKRRLSESAFSSGLSVPDFAACIAMGLRPVGLVQGFCAMQAGWSRAGLGMSAALGPVNYGGYVQHYGCPHGMIMGTGEHRPWGQNYEATFFESAWTTGYETALSRMVEEAGQLGAHGVVGVIDTEAELADAGITEYHLRGTAVVVEGSPAPTTVWTTELAGQRLAKAFEAGYAPVAAVGVVASVCVWANCITMWQLEGSTLYTSGAPSEIDQVVAAKAMARQLAREKARTAIGHDELHGVTWREVDHEAGSGSLQFGVIVHGSRLRRAGDAAPLAAPTMMRVLA